MEHDDTEGARRLIVGQIAAGAVEDPVVGRQILEMEHGQVWDTQELQRDFDVHGFLAPFVSVVRKSDGAKGALMFQHRPRFYFDFTQQ
jgi:hypothetical protein